ncbi:MAG TPA: ComEC/Rec2 family competence protein, partial [Terrimesophilobacter sp.]|nr:ComEC/Rec2 family competence protein [Terrimesophilobacter sp.]
RLPDHHHGRRPDRADRRAGIEQRLHADVLDGGDLLSGLAIGDTSAVSDTLDQAMIDTALSHLTAVSGANCAVVVGLVMALCSALGLSRRVRVGVSLLTLLGFVVLVTPDASVVRAATMATVVLLSLGSGRPARGVPVLALAVAVLLMVDPWWCRSFGFVLSVLATAGLLVLAPVLAGALERWMPSPLALVLAVPLAAQLACQPVLILLTPAIPVYGVVANVLAAPAAPAAPVATVVGLLACVTLPVLPPLGAALAAIAWMPSAWVAGVARHLAGLPGASAPWVEGVIGVLLVIVLVVLIMRAATHDRRASAILVIALTVYLAVVAGLEWGRRATIPTDWQIAACPIGQGDAMLVRSTGRVALIDTGPDPELLDDCLSRLGIGHIDLLVLSHYDLDHVGGIAAVHGRVDFAIVADPGTDPDALTVLRGLAKTGTSVSTVAAGATGRLGELRWRVVWPPSSARVDQGNDSSVVVAFEGVGDCAGGCLSSLFLGDLGELAQARLLAIAHPGPVDVVKVSHHGSGDQSERLYERLAGWARTGTGTRRRASSTRSRGWVRWWGALTCTGSCSSRPALTVRSLSGPTATLVPVKLIPHRLHVRKGEAYGGASDPREVEGHDRAVGVARGSPCPRGAGVGAGGVSCGPRSQPHS